MLGRSYLLRVAGLSAAAVMLSVGALAQTPSEKVGARATVSKNVTSAFESTRIAHELTAADVEAFLDGLMPAQLDREDIAGAVIAVVKDGQVLFAKGYGYADVAKKKAVTADATLFRPGSISKLFVWTSVMQLVEQGKLDLDRDVNDYLDFKIPAAFGKAITLRNIMTHTPGFEESGRDLFVVDAQHLPSLAQYVREHIPTRIFPPGTVPAYSNYATTLAGYIVQRVSGRPFEKYVYENILGPLEMNHTTFVQPLPGDLAPLMSVGYLRGTGDAKGFEFVGAFPAGSVSTTARDMCNFMIAHLQGGSLGNARILRPETARLMHSRIFAADERMNGMAHGFYEESANGHRIIGHGGDTVYFHSDLHLMLDAGVGLFISYNSAGKGEVSPRSIVFEKFLGRYFPYEPPPGEKLSSAQADANMVAGFYKTSRRFESSFLRLNTWADEMRVIPKQDGTIEISPLKSPNGELRKWEEIAPLLYREIRGQRRMAFKRDSTGTLQFELDFPVFIFQKAGLIENKHFNIAVLGFGLGTVVLTVLLWPIAAMMRKHYGRPLELSAGARQWRLLARVACFFYLAFFLGWVVALGRADSPADINTLPPWILSLGCIGILCLMGTVLAILNAYHSWGEERMWIWTKLMDTALALACVSLGWFAITWKLISFNTHF